MSSEERKLRMEFAIQIIDDVYTDVCRTRDGIFTHDEVREFCDFVIGSRKFVDKYFDRNE